MRSFLTCDSVVICNFNSCLLDWYGPMISIKIFHFSHLMFVGHAWSLDLNYNILLAIVMFAGQAWSYDVHYNFFFWSFESLLDRHGPMVSAIVSYWLFYCFVGQVCSYDLQYNFLLAILTFAGQAFSSDPNYKFSLLFIKFVRSLL